MEPLFVCIATDRGQKGDQKSVDRQEPRRFDDQDSGAGRCAGPLGALSPYARIARGNNWRGRATRRAQLWRFVGRQGL
jgi:hypothetical protein